MELIIIHEKHGNCYYVTLNHNHSMLLLFNLMKARYESCQFYDGRIAKKAYKLIKTNDLVGAYRFMQERSDLEYEYEMFTTVDVELFNDKETVFGY